MPRPLSLSLSLSLPYATSSAHATARVMGGGKVRRASAASLASLRVG